MTHLKWEQELAELLKDPDMLLRLAKDVSITTTQDFRFVSMSGNGPFIWDANGKRYFDFHSAVGSMNLGHAVHKVEEAIFRQGFLLDQFSDQDVPNAVSTLLKLRLTQITPGRFPKKVFLCNSGTEAIEGAIKMLLAARPERRYFISFVGAFHGRTLGSLALHGSKDINRERFPQSLEVIRLPFPEVGKYADENDWWRKFFISMGAGNILRPWVNGVFIELVQGEGGINVADPRIVQSLCRFLKGHGIKLVVDEIQTGFYRTGKLFACEHYGIEPDIICFGKAAGGSLPFGAVVANADLDFDKPGRLSNTFGGSQKVAAAALTVIELMQSLDMDLLKRNIEILTDFAPEGLGLMRRWRFESKELRDAFVMEAENRGVHLLGAGRANVRFMPQVNIPTELLEEALAILRSIDIPHL
ncbi:MAG: aminotransferase class III-fold pyridoxal phosphate-dependent enzyme [Candidatus Liptonbacteria bacterium]|nr:aminotransferase class III-fold pyridoxal phosphate-dependent enzyme [Candidatus Liptonbacteria bacterium]